jgi:acyl-CoA reductase-like NAD-dependent aldehyde dehydrogenase
MSTAESSPATVQGMFVGGAWRPSASGETFAATSPATGEVIGSIPQGDRSDAQAAVAAAAQAFPGWAAQTAFARAAALHRIADVCERRRDELARALTLDQGKPLHAESYDEVDELLAMWRGAAEDGVRLEGSIPPSASPGKRVLLMRRPLGPVAVVTPWNWPYTMPAEIVAPALAAGNTVVWTPAPSAPPTRGPSPSASSARPRPAGASPSGRRASACCSRWAATARSSCSTAPTWTPRPRRP